VYEASYVNYVVVNWRKEINESVTQQG